MGTTQRVLVSNLEGINFDKLCALALALVHVAGIDPNDVTFVRSGDDALDIEGDAACREYWKTGYRSMTEMFAITRGLGKPRLDGLTLDESPIRGLVSLCKALAQNHGKVQGKDGGQLYRQGTIPMIARNLVALPEQAPEIAQRIMKAVAKALTAEHPILALIEAVTLDEDSFWDLVNGRLANAERAVSRQANSLALDLANRNGNETIARFPLARAPKDEFVAEGVTLWTKNPNLMKHLWASLKSHQALRIAVAVVVNPDTGRIAVLTSSQEKLDIRPVLKALTERFPGADFDVNFDRVSLVWDTRFSKNPGPDAAAMAQVVGEHLTFVPPPPAQTPFKMTLGDRIRTSQRG